MKLFQRLLVAPAALGLFSPLAVNATEVNLNSISDYSGEELEINSNSFKSFSNEKPLLISGGEGLVDDVDSFSTTTTASFSADFAIGGAGVEGTTASSEGVMAGYGFQIDLNTSFTGEDSFDVSLDAGNADDGNLDELDLNDSGDGLQVDGIAYTFPLGDKTTVFVGDNMDGSTLYSTACVYGGQTNTLDDCGNAYSALAAGKGTAAGASYDIGNGFSAAIGYEGEGDTTDGLLTDGGDDAYGAQLTYAADQFGLSVTYANIEVPEAGVTGATTWALNGYWTPEETGTAVPSISVGYESEDPDSAVEEEGYFIGLTWDDFGPGSLSIGMSTLENYKDTETELYQYEAAYSYAVNDGMTITPGIFITETAGSADDQTGFILKTSFSF